MTIRYPRLTVAGLKGGSGKTILTLALIAFWKQKGLCIVPFKKGPDYIDGGWLSSAAGMPCYNLDSFLIGESNIVPSFLRHARYADIAIIEGNRGLYDGMDEKGTYSTAELSKIIKSPVILILDCTKVTRTVSAMVLGMQKFDRKVGIKGVVLNKIAGARHEKIIRETIERYCNIPVVGVIPKLNSDFLSERHMGLIPFQEHSEVKKAISFTKEIAKKYLEHERILMIANESPRLKINSRFKNPTSTPFTKGGTKRVRIGIIRDSAFQFYYPENFEELERKGAMLIEISALKEKKLPEIDALYIGGGFPETHAIALAKNTDFRKSLKKAVENNLPVYAECGGLMYLGESLIIEGNIYPMAGIFPVKFSLEKKPQAHGYSIAEVQRDNPYYAKGAVIKGHEFHYSRVINPETISRFSQRNIFFSFKMARGEGIFKNMDGLCYKNVLATYTHMHALGTPEWAEGMIKKAVEHQLKLS